MPRERFRNSSVIQRIAPISKLGRILFAENNRIISRLAVANHQQINIFRHHFKLHCIPHQKIFGRTIFHYEIAKKEQCFRILNNPDSVNWLFGLQIYGEDLSTIDVPMIWRVRLS